MSSGKLIGTANLVSSSTVTRRYRRMLQTAITIFIGALNIIVMQKTRIMQIIHNSSRETRIIRLKFVPNVVCKEDDRTKEEISLEEAIP
jgi:hypothetical protein